jgi:hypothetical protein
MKEREYRGHRDFRSAVLGESEVASPESSTESKLGSARLKGKDESRGQRARPVGGAGAGGW